MPTATETTTTATTTSTPSDATPSREPNPAQPLAPQTVESILAHPLVVEHIARSTGYSTEFTFRAPLHVLLGEAADRVRFVETYWERRDENGVMRPGLCQVGPTFDHGITKRIRDLAQAIHLVQFAYLTCTDGSASRALVERGQALVEEMFAVLSYFTSRPGVDPALAARLTAVETAHASDPEGPDALACECEDYADLCLSMPEANGVGGFRLPLVTDDAKKTALDLRALPERSSGRSSEQQKQLLEARNQMLNLLVATMNEVKDAARLIFRDYPGIIRQTTSAYVRQRRAAQRRSKQEDAQQPADGSVTPPPAQGTQPAPAPSTQPAVTATQPSKPQPVA